VRELENAMHRAVLLAEGPEIGCDVLELQQERPVAGREMPSLVGRTVDDVERTLILDTLSHCLGNRTRAAEILGISIRALRNKLQDYRALGMHVPPALHGLRVPDSSRAAYGQGTAALSNLAATGE
jgi:DNA-binding NtrC family response regulator